MLRRIMRAIRWLIGLGRKFVRVTPKDTLRLIASAVVSQVSLVLAFVLPVKIVILLGRPEAPSYLPWPLTAMTHQWVLITLSLSAVGFYALHLAADAFAKRTGDRGAEAVLEASSKLTVFEKQDDIARKAYRDYCTALASLLFAMTGVAALGWLYPLVAVLLLGYTGAVVALLLLLRSGRDATDPSQSGPERRLKVASGLGFILLFIGILIDQLYLRQQVPAQAGMAPLTSIIALLIGRQVLNRLVAGVTALLALYADRSRLDLLFRRRTPVRQAERARPEQGLLDCLAPANRCRWVNQLCSAFPGMRADIDRVHWCDSQEQGLFTLHCSAASGQARLLKVYLKPRSVAATHEAALLQPTIPGLPAPRWIGHTDDQGHPVHLLDLGETERLQPPPADQLAAAQLAVLAQLIAVEPPRQLVDRYQRSKPMLWQRLSRERLQRLRLVAEHAAQRAAVDRLARQLRRLTDELRRAPLAIVNPKLRSPNLVLLDNDAPLLLDWSHWTLEPLGSGCLSKQESLLQASDALGGRRLRRIRRDPRARVRFELAAQAYELDQCLARWSLVSALELVAPLQATLDSPALAQQPKQPKPAAQDAAR
jgi:NADH:ubiquinone oxidoreductase subunit 6 (subunit J)